LDKNLYRVETVSNIKDLISSNNNSCKKWCSLIPFYNNKIGFIRVGAKLIFDNFENLNFVFGAEYKIKMGAVFKRDSMKISDIINVFSNRYAFEQFKDILKNILVIKN